MQPERGKDGVVILVRYQGKPAAHKVFIRKTKSKKSILFELKCLKRAAELGIAPQLYGYDIVSSPASFVMQALGKTLVDVLNEERGILPDHYQRKMIDILDALDRHGIFHGDVSALNFMTGIGMESSKLYVIDFGMSSRITPAFRRLNGNHPNIKLGITYFILRIREQFPAFMPTILLEKVQSVFGLS